MFSNFTPYRYSGPALAASLSLPAFVPCLPSQEESIGFVPHDKHLIVRIERKAVPSQALKRRVDELAAQVEQQTGRKPGKKARADLTEQARAELLPRAFPKRKDVHVTFLGDLLLIGSTSQADLDAITTLLIANREGLLIQLLLTAQSPANVMSSWLLDLDDLPAKFAVGRAAVLAGITGKVRYSEHTLDCDNVHDHVVQGKVVEELALDYAERVSFTLTDALQFKSASLGDLVFEGQEQHADSELAADAELFLWRAELAPLLADVIEQFGGVTQ